MRSRVTFSVDSLSQGSASVDYANGVEVVWDFKLTSERHLGNVLG
jgi:hypothetical protein